MKILVFAHRLEFGGTQTNAIDLAFTIRSTFGHDVVLFATPGPALALARSRDLQYIPAPIARSHPSPAVIRSLRSAVRRERPDLIHVWDWPQCLDAYYGLQLLRPSPMLCTVMSMTVPRFLPRSIPVTFGTPALQAEGRGCRRGIVDLLVPPIDTDADDSSVVDTEDFRKEYGLDDDHLNIVVVSRLVSWLKLEGLRRTIDAVGILAAKLPVRLVIVGEGPAEPELRRLAGAVDERNGRQVVVFTGGMLDPRPAYAAADIAVGMGSSALRAMSFGKPLVVLGELGFSEILSPESIDLFDYQGFYGIGGRTSGDRLPGQLHALADNEAERRRLGEFGRTVAVRTYSLAPIAGQLELTYQRVLEEPLSHAAILAEAARTAALRAGAAAVPPRLRAYASRLNQAPGTQWPR